MMTDLLDLIEEDWVRKINCKSLKQAPTAQVSDHLRERLSDLVWRAQWGEDKIPVDLLMEFQSTVDRSMALRLQINAGLHSQCLLEAKQVSQRGRLPRVFPMLLYNGRGRWTTPEDASKLFEDAPAGLDRYLPRQPYYLLDVQRFDVSRLKGRKNAAAALIRLENARWAEDIEKVVSDLIKWFPGSRHQALRRAFAAWLCQVLLPARFPEGEFPQIEELQEVKSMLAERVREWPREWEERGWNRGLKEGLEKGREEGRDEGWEEGLQQGIRLGEARLLEQQLRQKFGKLSKTLRDRISKADSQSLSELAERVLTAETLDQVLNGQ